MSTQVFTEEVFVNGRSKLKPIEAQIQKIKDKLEEDIGKQNRSYERKEKHLDTFNPKAFWKSTLFKELEDQISKIFGFRTVTVEPFIERYNSKDDTFSSKIINAVIWSNDRYPIEGLVTENGFYDKSRSININIAVSLGLIRALEADEITAVLLHEFGHGIDPALVDIKYTEINILSKYLTDRKGAINKSEKRYISKKRIAGGAGFIIILPIALTLNIVTDFITFIRGGVKKRADRKLKKIRKKVAGDKDVFVRQNFSEAYADNFARMYGYGPQLARGLQKMSNDTHKLITSRCKRERERQDLIIMVTQSFLKDEHKTDIHRIKALIREYESDINNPDIPAVAKKQLREDMEELKKILEEYTNNFSDFQNRVNQIIIEELDKVDGADNEPRKNPIMESSETDQQVERLEKYLVNEYDCKAEYLWKKYPSYRVYRHPENEKWYALFMDVQRDSVGLQGTDPITIVNIKSDEDTVKSLNGTEGFCTAHYMSKKTWIGVILNSTVPDKKIKELLDAAYKSVKPAKPKEEAINEEYEFYPTEDVFFGESKRAREKIRKEMEAITSEEYKLYNKLFPDHQCSLARDKNGYYVRTHRCRSKSYESIEKIPKKDVDFVSSTS